ncbi:MAG TPA: hypothetical protein VFM98_23410 [Ramlibacter sp.]|uniref:hypothetical protein n=1 Tax=Ramlibacter sp. TaxID=1917967 RepID=UPI002D7FA952|nr:hypothetical protein [Ramlibacter sp.]HET8748562.1 hypothetical protein [Ramlibacter sp.]
MHARALRCLVTTAAAFAFWNAHAEMAPEARCEVPAPQGSVLADRAGLLAQYERLPQGCLQEMFRACSQASRRSLMDLGSAAVCSLGYEALLRQQFDGNFPALLAWWRTQQEETAIR